MTNEIQIFNSPEFGEIRTVMIDGEPWFVGNDISQVLGYANPKGAIQKHVAEEDKLGHQFDTSGQKREMTIINESGLYSLIFGSKLESAKKFKRWVTSEVLPQLRKTGSYGMAQLPMSTQDQIKLLAQGNVELNQRVDTLNDRMDRFEKELPLFPSEAEEVSLAATRRGIMILGGKKSAAYKNPSIRASVYRNLYIYLNYNFGTKRYKEIKRGQLQRAVEVAENWQPPAYLAEEIDRENATIQ